MKLDIMRISVLSGHYFGKVEKGTAVVEDVQALMEHKGEEI